MAEWEVDTPSPPDRSPGKPGPSTTRQKSPGAPTTPTASSDSTTAPPHTMRPRGRGWFLPVAAGLVMLTVGLLSGFYIARSYSHDEAAQLRRATVELSELRAAQAQSEQRNWDYYRLVEALRTENEALKGQGGPPSSGGPGVPVPEGSYVDGVYLVGEDIQAGTYEGRVTGQIGYWARLSATDGSVGSINANAIVRGPFVLSIVEADIAVELRGVIIAPH